MEKAISLSTLKRINIAVSLIPVIAMLPLFFDSVVPPHQQFSFQTLLTNLPDVASAFYIYSLSLLPSLLLIFFSTRTQKKNVAIKILICSIVNTILTTPIFLFLYWAIQKDPFMGMVFFILPGFLFLVMMVVYFLTNVFLKSTDPDQK